MNIYIYIPLNLFFKITVTKKFPRSYWVQNKKKTARNKSQDRHENKNMFLDKFQNVVVNVIYTYSCSAKSVRTS